MPRRTDISHVLVIGSGPIVIGQACEFDYSGTQACRVLRSEGIRVSLINSNPATIMTDPEFADATYIEPINAEFVEKVLADQLARGFPVDAVLATLGGQTALNTAIALDERGVLEKYGVELIGASVDAIKLAEDRLLFREAMREIGADVPRSVYCRSLDEAMNAVEGIGFPAIIRPSFTMGGVGGGIAYNIEEFRESATRGLSMSPVHEILVEQSVIGWKEFELEVKRDGAENFVFICSIEKKKKK
jgi:carbamoyl-phosphate synthase large subunit